MREPRPAPPVTISGGPAPLLQQGAPEPAPEQAARGRRTPLVLAAVVVLAVLGVAELRERAAAEEAARAGAERERSVVSLEISTPASGSTSYQAATDSVTFLALLRVSNTGPRTVTVTAVDVPGVQLLAPATLTPGGERGLTLRGERSCRDELGGLLDLDRLPLEVRTDAGPQSFDLVLDGTLLYGDALRRACGLTRPGLS